MERASVEALLALADGSAFRGRSFGATGEAAGEVVFNTAMSGYQEILTDPSYEGQLVAMTYPEIGNYGVADEDDESRGTMVAGFIIREQSPMASNWRADSTLRDFLVRNNIVAISDIDTRALTRVLRSSAVMRNVLQTRSSTSADTWILRPCSSHVYQVTLTPASAATSSRRNPGVRRRFVSGRPTWAGESRARQPLRKSMSCRRWVSIRGLDRGSGPIFPYPRR